MITVAIDTSCMTGGVAILDGERLVAEYILSVRRTHSERLMSSLARAMEDAELKPADIGLVSCCVGPGSFTGIRIGVASAKAMGMALGIRVAPVTGLEALCYGLPAGERAFAMIDAKHGFCYAASFMCTGGAPEPVMPPYYMGVEEIASEIARGGVPHHMRGDGALAYAKELTRMAGRLAVIPSPEDGVIRPSKVGLCGIIRHEAGGSVDPAVLEPSYVKRSEAEIKAGGKCSSC